MVLVQTFKQIKTLYWIIVKMITDLRKCESFKSKMILFGSCLRINISRINHSSNYFILKNWKFMGKLLKICIGRPQIYFVLAFEFKSFKRIYFESLLNGRLS